MVRTGGRCLAIVFNPASGAQEVTAAGLRALCGQGLAKQDELLVHEVAEGADVRQLADRAVADGCDTVVAAGGDGTVSAVASALVGRDVALGVLPLGTANSFAAGLGIPDDLSAAAAILSGGAARVIDSLEANGRGAVLHVSVGLHAEAITDTAPESKQRWGALAYLATAWNKLAEHEPFAARLVTPAETVSVNASAILVANVAPARQLYAQGTGEVLPGDGLLDVTVMTVGSRADVIAAGFTLVTSAAFATAVEGRHIFQLRTPAVRVEAVPAAAVMVDGEDVGVTPVDVKCRPRSLRVLVPADG